MPQMRPSGVTAIACPLGARGPKDSAEDLVRLLGARASTPASPSSMSIVPQPWPGPYPNCGLGTVAAEIHNILWSGMQAKTNAWQRWHDTAMDDSNDALLL